MSKKFLFDKDTLSSWWTKIDNQELAMPRYQREPNVWRHKTKEGALLALLRGEPLGSCLVGNTDQRKGLRFFSETNEKTHGNYRVLLDGQQRLITLWEAMQDIDPERSYYVQLHRVGQTYQLENVISLEKERGDGDPDAIRQKTKSLALSRRKQLLREEGIDGLTEKEIKEKKADIKKRVEQERIALLPLPYIRQDITIESDRRVKQWLSDNSEKDADKNALHKLIKNIQQELWEFPLPRFELTRSSNQAEQIKIFVNTNRYSVQLTEAEIVIAEKFDEQSGKSLYDVVDAIQKRAESEPVMQRIYTLENKYRSQLAELVLKIACLTEGKKPTKGQYKTLDFQKIYANQKAIVDGIELGIRFLGENFKAHNSAVLPSGIPLRVIPALYVNEAISKDINKEQHIKKILEDYVWRAFLTHRYTDGRVDGPVSEDYRGIERHLLHGKPLEDAPIFNMGSEGLLSREQLIGTGEKSNYKYGVGWPTSGILAKGILLLASSGESKTPDISHGGDLLYADTHRDILQFHHVFPQAKMIGIYDSGEGEREAGRVLNAMLIKEASNQEWKDKWPRDALDYILTKKATLQMADLKKHLTAHSIELSTVADVTDGKTNQWYMDAYQAFINARADIICKKLQSKGLLSV